MPRIHIIQNMDNQPKYVSQEAKRTLPRWAELCDHRVEGTIARGDNDWMTRTFFMGIVDDDWATTVSRYLECLISAFVERGQNRFFIYCSLRAMGKGGFGDGLIHQTSIPMLVETGTNGTSWVAPKNLHEDRDPRTILSDSCSTRVTKGVRTMSGIRVPDSN